MASLLLFRIAVLKMGMRKEVYYQMTLQKLSFFISLQAIYMSLVVVLLRLDQGRTFIFGFPKQTILISDLFTFKGKSLRIFQFCSQLIPQRHNFPPPAYRLRHMKIHYSGNPALFVDPLPRIMVSVNTAVL